MNVTEDGCLVRCRKRQHDSIPARVNRRYVFQTPVVVMVVTTVRGEGMQFVVLFGVGGTISLKRCVEDFGDYR